jgi:hypothetical protein
MSRLNQKKSKEVTTTRTPAPNIKPNKTLFKNNFLLKTIKKKKRVLMIKQIV